MEVGKVGGWRWTRRHVCTLKALVICFFGNMEILRAFFHFLGEFRDLEKYLKNDGVVPT